METAVAETSTPYSAGGFRIEPPISFRVQDTSVGFVTGMPSGTASPSLVVQTKPARTGATVDAVAAELLAELLQTIPGMAQGSKGELTFDDGVKGVILSYSMQSGRGELRQYFVVRVSDARVCTAVLTVPVKGLNDAVAQSMMKCLKSIRPA
jgi:hypothetical protein